MRLRAPPAPALFSALQVRAEAIAGVFKPQEAANLLWALSKVAAPK